MLSATWITKPPGPNRVDAKPSYQLRRQSRVRRLRQTLNAEPISHRLALPRPPRSPGSSLPIDNQNQDPSFFLFRKNRIEESTYHGASTEDALPLSSTVVMRHYLDCSGL